MDKEQIVDFNRRISQSNRSELVVIMYDIFFAYTADAKMASEQGAHGDYKDAIHSAQAVLDRLMAALNFEYPVSRDLYKLYQFSKRELARALYENRLEGVLEAEKILKKLRASFVEVAAQDTSGPLMSNTQQVVAGMTYGRGSLTENFIGDGYNRGFLA